jgi:class 3 adenylate cyclase
VLEQHVAILRSVVESHSGYVFETAGDSLVIAFPTAPDGWQQPWMRSAHCSARHGRGAMRDS